jgi:hypothetical protein
VPNLCRVPGPQLVVQKNAIKCNIKCVIYGKVKKHHKAPFWDELLDQLMQQLKTIESENGELVPRAQHCIQECKNYIALLQDYIVRHTFGDENEEVLFFKTVKPQFYSRLLYYHKLYNLEVGRPVGGGEELKKYYQSALLGINTFFNENKFFYKYYRSGADYLDHQLFLRHNLGLHPHFQVYDLLSHPNFTTHYDFIFSQIIANDTIQTYINDTLKHLDGQSTSSPTAPLKSKLTWTDPKIGLIEIIYAWKAKGCFNNGNATLREIIDAVQVLFNIELTNPSRDFQVILSRSAGYEIYLKKLIESYLLFIENNETKNLK